MLFFLNTLKIDFQKNLNPLKLSGGKSSQLPKIFTLRKKKGSLFSLKALEKEKEENLIEKEKKEENGNSVFSFIKEVIDETRMVEWPSIERLFKQFVIVVISLVLSAFIIYSVDGFFASLSQFLFEGKS